MVRTLLAWRMDGEDLVGTCHLPADFAAGHSTVPPPVGFLLLNPGPAMRSGNSDLSVRIGDRLALRGFPVFRFDLPGLGDSSGSIPRDVDAYWREVVDGRNDAVTVALVDRIQLEFDLRGLVVGGLCAATLPSVRALGAARRAPVGLLLLEPSFHLGELQPPGSDRPPAQRVPRLDGAQEPYGPHGVTSRRPASLPSRCAARLRALARRAWRIATGRALPGGANLALLELWRAGLERGVDSLVLVAAGHGTDRYLARILRCLPRAAVGRIERVRVPGTNHLFTAGSGPEAVLSALEGWVVRTFGAAESAQAVPRSRS